MPMLYIIFTLVSIVNLCILYESYFVIVLLNYIVFSIEMFMLCLGPIYCIHVYPMI